MKADILAAEIGSTTTVVNAFAGMNTDNPRFLGQGFSRTTVVEGDVRIGLEKALDNLKAGLGTEELEGEHFFASSSAAGGLRMSVHGLVYDMTVTAAKEAALGAGANIVHLTAGKMRRKDLEKLKDVNPGIILIAGGVDYGEKETALHNSEAIARIFMNSENPPPVIYAGNREIRGEIADLFSAYGGRFVSTENVYPGIDELNVLPVRGIIQEIFEEHIIKAPGMEGLREIVSGPIIPTPGAVMLAATLLKENIGDLVVFDIGGATTDVHSVTSGSEKVSGIMMSVQPEAKRTVEGDLGVYVNRRNVLKGKALKDASVRVGMSEDELSGRVDALNFLPRSREEREIVKILAKTALKTALERHAGFYRYIYGVNGRTKIAEGKDLTAVKYCIGTGGVLSRLANGEGIIRSALNPGTGKYLLPPENTPCLIDRDYIMASLGVVSKKYPEAAVILLKKSLGMES